MKLILIRHAKSSWDYDFDDHDRPLAIRGINDAQLVFKNHKNIFPKNSSIFCSSAVRTIQTAKIFATKTNLMFDSVLIKNELYTFDCDKLVKIVKKNNVDTLIIFGHNNAITDFVNKYGDYYIPNVPTCGVVIIKFENSNTISPKKGVITKTIFPRDLR